MTYLEPEISKYVDPLPERPDVVDALTAEILSFIKEADLQPGNKLPSEKQIGEAMNASRTSVRRALGALKAVGIIESRAGMGWFVKAVEPDDFINPQLIPFVLMGESLRDLLDARKLLECEVARLAARCSPEELKPLEDVLDEMAGKLDSEQGIYQPAWNFHATLAEIAGNAVLAKLLRILFGMINEVQLELFWPRVDLREQLESHWRLYRAILQGEQEAAREMRDHIDEVYRVVGEAMKNGASTTGGMV